MREESNVGLPVHSCFATVPRLACLYAGSTPHIPAKSPDHSHPEHPDLRDRRQAAGRGLLTTTREDFA